MKATWESLLHDKPECYPTYQSRRAVPVDGHIVIAQKIGSEGANQVIRKGDYLYDWCYGTTDEVYAHVYKDDYIWRGCGGFDY